MAYELHIERHPEGLTLGQWIDAVKQLDGVKLDDADVKAFNPTTGESISIRGRPGNVVVLFQTKGILGFGRISEWRACIRFGDNRASFKATPDLESPDNPLRIAAAKLAKTLGATIVGDNGEVYEW